MAKCDHCDIEIHERDGGMVEIGVASPTQTIMALHTLCGLCSFTLGEFLCPSLKEDPVWCCELIEVTTKLKALYGITT